MYLLETSSSLCPIIYERMYTHFSEYFRKAGDADRQVESTEAGKAQQYCKPYILL